MTEKGTTIFEDVATLPDDEWRILVKRLLQEGRYKEAMESLRLRWREREKERLGPPPESKRAKIELLFEPGFMLILLTLLVGLLILSISLP